MYLNTYNIQHKLTNYTAYEDECLSRDWNENDFV